MNFHLQFQGTQNIKALDGTFQPSGTATLGQADNRQLVVDFTVDGLTLQDMTGYTLVASIVSRDHVTGEPGQGLPEGEPPGPPLASQVAGFAWNEEELQFTGYLNCNTAEMAYLIGEDPSATSVLEFTATNTVAPFDEFSVQVKVVILASVNKSGTVILAAAYEFEVTVLAGQMQGTAIVPGVVDGQKIVFTKPPGVGGPLPDSYTITTDPDDPAENTVTVNLLGDAPVNVTFTGILL